MVGIKERLLKFNEYVSPSGNERALLEYVKNEIQGFVDEVYFDSLDNLIAIKGKGCGEKVMLSAHADTIGVIAYYADENGFYRVNSLGGLNLKTLAGRRVRFTNGVEGVLMYETESDFILSKFFVDIGAPNRAEALKRLPVGTAGSIAAEVFNLTDDLLCAPFMDNRIAVAIQMEVLEKLQAVDLKNEICAVFSVQEELGLRGARVAAYNIDPKYGIAIDVTTSGDVPKSGEVEMKLCEGACIKIIDSSLYCSPSMVDFLRKTAQDCNIKYQFEILTAGGTDAGAIQNARNGVYSGAVSIPTRYIHTPCEVVSLSDCGNVVKLISSAVEKGFTF